MSHNARESLSALMDNEGDELELRRVLKSLDDAPDVAEIWRRYHLMRSVLRREPGIDVASDLSAGIMARLQDEPLPRRGEGALASGRPVSLARGAGIAAAVTLMVISGVQFYNGSLDSQQAPSSVALQGPSADARQAASPSAFGGSGLAASGFEGRSTLPELPFLQTPPGNARGAMTVGADFRSPPFLSPRQSARDDLQQAQLLQSYLDRHAQGAAYRSGDTWLPLLRASGSESLGQR
ncbi:MULTISPECIES: sigma-E factor negative regulatory protein [Halomonas]|uniref:Sigma-E factor negative regulatory protein RseA n=1 Tax=Halomonas ventosae TaxID=229007 RepID=A0A4R6HTV4_9GAMM|nr:sigma-E factor negative regulatory protein [Halomonas ventosae]TDO12643.1 sigma-E factor negative regulatory protein RseA [Halomonas ventosae]